MRATMNGENNHIFHTAALAAANIGQGGLSLRACLFVCVGPLRMLAAFIGLALPTIAGSLALYDGAGHGRGELVAMGLAGVLLLLSAGRGLVRVVRRAEYEVDRERGWRQTTRSSVNMSPVPAQARTTGTTPTW